MVSLTKRLVVIFGGGRVGARKARYFSDEADVIVYSRSFHQEFEDISCSKVSINLKIDETGIRVLIKDAALVIAATSDIELNEKILEVTLSCGILCNVAAGKPGNVILPAKISGSRYTIGVTTKGSVPAISRMIREHIEDAFPDLDDLVILGEWMRNEFRQKDGERSYDSLLHAALRDPITRKCLKLGQDKAREYILETYT